ncbi:hypothetical protein [Rhodopirellula halodulae]|uniref:hypothetical protein n=1 Tax=Rhodopirellula halodulae TaxID=2894198 RepID=UPI001E634A1D|nr:hypothetical protein [Rhodopirellula sp. JC737]MCC9656070.1 hypothetical protein [Rhodopirellula sp. JC737]
MSLLAPPSIVCGSTRFAAAFTRWSGMLVLTGMIGGLSGDSQACAQGFKPGAQNYGAAQGVANEVTSFDARLVASRGNILTVEREDGTQVMVQTPDSPAQLTFIAKALPAYLRPGMLVRFRANLGPTGTPLAPVEKLELFAPVNPKMLKGRERERYQPGVHSDNHAARGNNGPPSGPVTVVGNLMALNPQGGLALRAGNIPVQTMTSPELELQIRVNNLSMAQPGDPVHVRGFYQPPDETKVKAETIEIKPDRVYGETPPPNERRSRRGKRGEADAGENANKADKPDMPAEAKEDDAGVEE